jgi:hypothetical protein
VRREQLVGSSEEGVVRREQCGGRSEEGAVRRETKHKSPVGDVGDVGDVRGGGTLEPMHICK